MSETPHNPPKTTTHGGARQGAGRHKSPSRLKKVPCNVRLPLWMKEWLFSDTQTQSAPKIIEKALIETYGLKVPGKEELNES